MQRVRRGTALVALFYLGQHASHVSAPIADHACVDVDPRGGKGLRTWYGFPIWFLCELDTLTILQRAIDGTLTVFAAIHVVPFSTRTQTFSFSVTGHSSATIAPTAVAHVGTRSRISPSSQGTRRSAQPVFDVGTARRKLRISSMQGRRKESFAWNAMSL